MNYFNYFTEIEDAFVRRRGKHLLISPGDWALIESWKEMQVPLHVALRGIERAFDSWESKPRKRTIKSLLYCQEEVEAQYAEWLESRIGAGQIPEADSQSDGAMPFSRAAILDHLRKGRSELSVARDLRLRIGGDDLSEALRRAADLLHNLEDEWETATVTNAQSLEQSLTGLERMVAEALLAIAETENLSGLKKEVKEQLKSYRKHMEPAVYQQTFDNLLMKRLREHYRVPRLSLFYL